MLGIDLCVKKKKGKGKGNGRKEEHVLEQLVAKVSEDEWEGDSGLTGRESRGGSGGEWEK